MQGEDPPEHELAPRVTGGVDESREACLALFIDCDDTMEECC